MRDSTSGRQKIVKWILGIDTALERPSVHLDIVLAVAHLPAASYADLFLDYIHTGDHLSDRMFDLQAGVHFEEVIILIFVHQELNRARIFIFHCLGSAYREHPHAMTQIFIITDKRRWRFL